MQTNFFSAVIALLLCAVVQAQDRLLTTLANKLEAQYVFPEKGVALAAKLREAGRQKTYAGLQAETLAARLTKDLQDWSGDKHLRVAYSADTLANLDEVMMEMPDSMKAGFYEYLRHDNYGINKLEVLRGNIGYIDFRYLCTPEAAGNSYAAAMNYLASTDALIVDLRRCGGSTSPDAIPFLLSYLFEKPTHLNDLYWRKGNITNQAWTYAVVPGKHYGNKPVYVLTGNATFSGAEELAYDLQQLKRATLVGQRTGGGANGGGDVKIDPHFSVFIPSGRAINPITKTNWEGVGVMPDSVVPTNKALYAAHLMAVRGVLKTTTDQGYKQYLTEALKQLEQTRPQLVPVTFTLRGFDGAKEVFVAGSFNSWAQREVPLRREGNRWIATVEAEPGRVEYKFIVDGVWMTDPANKNTVVEGQNTNSVLRVGNGS